jgi:hypothetical protein
LSQLNRQLVNFLLLPLPFFFLYYLLSLSFAYTGRIIRGMSTMPFAIRRQNPAEEQVVLQLQADLLLGHNDPVIEFAPCAEYLGTSC